MEEIKKKIHFMEKLRSSHHRGLRDCEDELKRLRETLRSFCMKKKGGHNYVIDKNEYDFHTHYICVDCGDFY